MLSPWVVHIGSVRVCIGSVMLCVGLARLSGFKHVGIYNAESSLWGSKPMRQPNENGVTVKYRLNKGT